jgi:hypothetical protein
MSAPLMQLAQQGGSFSAYLGRSGLISAFAGVLAFIAGFSTLLKKWPSLFHLALALVLR